MYLGLSTNWGAYRGAYGGIRGKGDSQMNKKLFIVCGKSHYIVFLHLAVINKGISLAYSVTFSQNMSYCMHLRDKI
jgi:hypothetical protein